MPSKKPSMIDAMRAKHDPHYKLAAKVAGLQDAGGRVDKVEKDIAVKLESLHKTLSKSFAMQRKALGRVAGVEGRIKNLETDGGLYKGIDLPEGLKISELLESTRSEFNNLSKSVLKAGDSTADEFTNLFINTELRDAIKENIAQSKNINMDPRKSHKSTEAGGVKVRVLGDDSNSYGFKIKNKK